MKVHLCITGKLTQGDHCMSDSGKMLKGLMQYLENITVPLSERFSIRG